MMNFLCAIPVFTVAFIGPALAFVALPSSHQIASMVSRRGASSGSAWASSPSSTVAAAVSRTAVTGAEKSSSRLRMGIFDDISTQMKTCLKSGDKERLGGLRIIRAAFITETKAAGSGDMLPDEKCITILRKLSKMQQESIDMYRTGKREDLVEKEVFLQEMIDAFLPKLADEATTEKWADAAIAAAGAKGPSDMGKVMGLLMKEHKAEMDGKLAQRLVSAKLKGA